MERGTRSVLQLPQVHGGVRFARGRISTSWCYLWSHHSGSAGGQGCAVWALSDFAALVSEVAGCADVLWSEDRSDGSALYVREPLDGTW